MYDLVIKSGTIVDGTRFPRYRADIAIRNGVIEKIGDIDAALGRETIDATGLIVAPGHIDPHTHYDAQIHWDPYCSNSGENGVTTVVTGNCGFGFAPCRPSDRERYMLMMENTEQVPLPRMKMALPWTWETFPEWLAHLKSLPKGVNLMMYVPVNPLTVYVMGIDAAKTRRPTQAEIDRMKRLIVEGMQAGACGIALSFLGTANTHTDFDGSPMPADMMHRDDVIALASALREVEAGTIQLLSQFAGQDDKELAVDMHTASGRPVILNIVLSLYGQPRAYADQLDWLVEQNTLGHRVYGQTLAQRSWTEFDLTEFNLNDNVPEWREISQLKSLDDKIAKLKDSAFRDRLRTNYDPKLMAGSGPVDLQTLIHAGSVARLEPYIGRTVGDIAKAWDADPIDVFFDISVETGGAATFRTPVFVGGDTDEAAEIVAAPYIVAGMSDGGAHTRFYIGGHWATELLTTLGRDKGVSLEDLHYRFAWQTARVMGLSERGALLPGYAADIIVYDFDKLDVSADRYTVRYDQPGNDWRRYIETAGYRWIVVNGQITFVDKQSTGALPGRLLGNAPKTRGQALAAE